MVWLSPLSPYCWRYVLLLLRSSQSRGVFCSFASPCVDCIRVEMLSTYAPRIHSFIHSFPLRDLVFSRNLHVCVQQKSSRRRKTQRGRTERKIGEVQGKETA